MSLEVRALGCTWVLKRPVSQEKMLSNFLYEVKFIKSTITSVILDRLQRKDRFQPLYAWELYRRKKFGRLTGTDLIIVSANRTVREYEELEKPKLHRVHLTMYRKPLVGRSNIQKVDNRMTEAEMADAYALKLEAEAEKSDKTKISKNKLDAFHDYIHLSELEIGEG
jgi:hypothetical protein